MDISLIYKLNMHGRGRQGSGYILQVINYNYASIIAQYR